MLVSMLRTGTNLQGNWLGLRLPHLPDNNDNPFLGGFVLNAMLEVYSLKSSFFFFFFFILFDNDRWIRRLCYAFMRNANWFCHSESKRKYSAVWHNGTSHAIVISTQFFSPNYKENPFRADKKKSIFSFFRVMALETSQNASSKKRIRNVYLAR